MDIRVKRYAREMWLTVASSFWKGRALSRGICGPLQILARGKEYSWYYQIRITIKHKDMLTEKW